MLHFCNSVIAWSKIPDIGTSMRYVTHTEGTSILWNRSANPSLVCMGKKRGEKSGVPMIGSLSAQIEYKHQDEGDHGQKAGRAA
jgi:hypothetical protein